MFFRLTMSLLALPVLLAPAHAGEHSSVMTADEFEQHVDASGGRVDFVFGDDRPFAQCHASTVVQTAGGNLIAAWFAGTREKHPDVGIWWSTFAGGEWTAPELLAKVNDTAHWNPVLFRDGEDHIHLFFKVGPEIPPWQTYWMSSTDHGATWNEPRELVPGDKGGRGPVRNQPIILQSGAWLAPSSTEIGTWESYADRSEDGGATWNRTPNFPIDRKELTGRGAIQPAFWESAPGHVHALMRTTGGYIHRSDSEDDGRTWSTLRRTDLANNNSGIDLEKLDDGRLLLVLNPVGGNWAARTPLDLAVSHDNGGTWQTIAHLEDDPAEGSEFSYPCISRTGDGVVISYTWNREQVRVWQIPLAALEAAAEE